MANTALLLMDVQQAIVGRVTDDTYLPRVARALDAARTAGLPVIHVVVGFRPGYPEISPRNKAFSALPPGLDGDVPGTRIAPELTPADGEIVVTKKRVSAFAGSDLDMVLRARDIDGLVLTGIATGGVVLSTLRQAADLDFTLTVLEDGCFDPDPEVHRVLTEKLFPRQAEVLTIDEWIKALTK